MSTELKDKASIMYKLTTFLIALCCVTNLFSKQTTIENRTTIIEKKLDSISQCLNNEISLNKKYLEIVDRTNNNLNMNWTPFNTTIAVVGISCSVISFFILLMAFGSRGQVSKYMKRKTKEFDVSIQEKLIEINTMIDNKLKETKVNGDDFLQEVDTKLVDVINLIKKQDKE